MRRSSSRFAFHPPITIDSDFMSKSFNRFPGNKAIIISNIQNDRRWNGIVAEKLFLLNFHRIWSPLNDIKAVYPDHSEMMFVINFDRTITLNGSSREKDSTFYANLQALTTKLRAALRSRVELVPIAWIKNTFITILHNLKSALLFARKPLGCKLLTFSWIFNLTKERKTENDTKHSMSGEFVQLECANKVEVI